MRFSLLVLTLLMAGTATFAKEYSLPYKNENRWVAKEDAKALRSLIRDAKKTKMTHFYVQLPEEKRNVSVERLMVLRDILERQVKGGIIIEEIESSNKPNLIIVHTEKK